MTSYEEKNITSIKACKDHRRFTLANINSIEPLNTIKKPKTPLKSKNKIPSTTNPINILKQKEEEEEVPLCLKGSSRKSKLSPSLCRISTKPFVESAKKVKYSKNKNTTMKISIYNILNDDNANTDDENDECLSEITHSTTISSKNKKKKKKSSSDDVKINDFKVSDKMPKKYSKPFITPRTKSKKKNNYSLNLNLNKEQNNNQKLNRLESFVSPRFKKSNQLNVKNSNSKKVSRKTSDNVLYCSACGGEIKESTIGEVQCCHTQLSPKNCYSTNEKETLLLNFKKKSSMNMDKLKKNGRKSYGDISSFSITHNNNSSDKIFEYANYETQPYNKERDRIKPKVLRNDLDVVISKIIDLETKLEDINEDRSNSSVNLISETSSHFNTIPFSVNVDNIIQLQKIGSGASEADVWSYKVDGWICACKRLDFSLSTPSCIESFNNEMQILYKLPYHRNIVRYLFHMKIKNVMCLFMSKYDETLADYIKIVKDSSETFTEKQIICICLNICNGMHYMHGNNIMHRDLKSGNVFITYGADNSIIEIVVGDFDVSKNVTNTRPTSTVGTPTFMAPEVIQSKDKIPYTKHADIFSFGMILYELITLNCPYYDKKVSFEISTAIINGEQPIIDVKHNDAYKNLITIHKQCIDICPEKRPTFGYLLDFFKLAYKNL